MKNSLRAVLCLCFGLAALAACSTPESRIRKNQELFATYPTDVQQAIRAGKVRIGFTKEMARMALGEPDRKYTQAAPGGVQDVWAYTESGVRPGVGLSIGGVFGSATGVGGGVSVGDDGVSNERARLVFQDGRLVLIQSRQK